MTSTSPHRSRSSMSRQGFDGGGYDMRSSSPVGLTNSHRVRESAAIPATFRRSPHIAILRRKSPLPISEEDAFRAGGQAVPSDSPWWSLTAAALQVAVMFSGERIEIAERLCERGAVGPCDEVALDNHAAPVGGVLAPAANTSCSVLSAMVTTVAKPIPSWSVQVPIP
jgi:hypothetical protein